MTKTFKRCNYNDRSKTYRRNDRKAFRTHFKINMSKCEEDGLNDIPIPDRKHYGKINYHMIPINQKNKINGYVSPKDINGNHSIMTETKNKFYNNTRQSKLIVEFNELIKENENFHIEQKEMDDTIILYDTYGYHDYDGYHSYYDRYGYDDYDKYDGYY